jgi:hypothetical protein
MAFAQRFDVFKYIEDIGLKTMPDDELEKRGRQLERVFRHFDRVNVVSGEASREVWTDRVLDEAERFLSRGGTATIVVGPLLSTDDNHKHPITDLAGCDGWNVFVSLHRQPVHFRVSDGARIFYLELAHEAAAPNREYFFDRKNPWLSSYFAHRFEHVLRSPNVRRLEDDFTQLKPVRCDAVPRIRAKVDSLRLVKGEADLTVQELATGIASKFQTYDDLRGVELTRIAREGRISA